MTKLDTTLEILDRLIAFPTVSRDSNADCIDWIEAYLTDLGARCDRSSDAEGKANLFATLGPEGDGGVVLSGHTDVVPTEGQDWTSDPFRMRREGDLLFGRGACDMKGFIACALAMAPSYAAATLRKPLHFAWTYDEEIGCLGARVMVADLMAKGLKPEVCIIGEPTNMRLIDGHKGCCEYTVEFTGVEGHSSLPGQAVNALEAAAAYMEKLTDLRSALPGMAPPESRFDPPHSTVSITGLQSGVAHNVIPNKAELKWEMRVVQSSDQTYIRDGIETFVDDHLRPSLKARSEKADVRQTFGSVVDALEPGTNTAAATLIRQLTGDNNADVVSFGTEAGIFQNAGISSALCGPGSIEQAHKPDEFVSVQQLQACLDMLENLTEHLT